MKRILLIAAAVMVVSCNVQTENKRSYGQANVDRASTEVTVVDEVKVLNHQAVFAGDPAKVEALFAAKGEQVDIGAIDADAGLYLAKFATDDLKKSIAEMTDVTEFVEPNYVLELNQDNSRWPRDPEFLRLWGLNNVGQSAPEGLEGRAGADIQLLDAWEITTGSNDIVVGVIDTGVDYNHPDLRDNIWVNEAEKNGTEGVDDDGNGLIDDLYGWDFVSAGRTDMSGGMPGDNDPMDDNGHGTHCSGTIGAVADNNLGVAGVAKKVRIMALKFLDSMGSGTSVDAFRAIRYGAENGAHVLSNSWGGGAESRLIKRAIEQANDAGVVFVAAAGNSSANTDLMLNYPSNYEVDNVISVGASDNLDNPASFTNYGKETVDVFAPGVAILSTIPTALGGSSPYASYSGTSMATPHISGVVALMLAADRGLIGNPVEVRDRLVRTSDVKPTLVGLSMSNGRVNALRAVTDDRNTDDIFGDLVEEDHAYVSPSFPTLLTDDLHTITKSGASAIRVHFDMIQVEEPWDSIYLYDKNRRLITHLDNNETADYWSPLIPGDTVHVRFVNARVRETQQVQKQFPTPEDGFAAGAMVCEIRPDATVWCWVDGGDAVEFNTFNSEGYVIDRIAYVQ